MTKPHVRIENDLFDHILLCNFGKRQLKIINLIYRLSVGCQHEWAIIPHKRDFESISILKNNVTKELGWLMTTGVVQNNGNLYRINPNFEEWDKSVLTDKLDCLTRLVRINLNGYQNDNSAVIKTITEGDKSYQNDNSAVIKTITEGDKSYQNDNSAVIKTITASDIKSATPTNKLTNNSVCVNKQQQLTTLYSTLHNGITPKISAAIGKFLKTYSPDEIDYAIRESARRGGKSSNYLQSILENRAADQWDIAPAADIRAELAALNKSKLLPPPSLPPADAWARSLEMIKPQMTTIGFDARFCDCAAVRWDGFCLILRAAPGCNNAEYKQFAGMIRSALIKVLDSDNVDYEFEREVEHAIQT